MLAAKAQGTVSAPRIEGYLRAAGIRLVALFSCAGRCKYREHNDLARSPYVRNIAFCPRWQGIA